MYASELCRNKSIEIIDLIKNKKSPFREFIKDDADEIFNSVINSHAIGKKAAIDHVYNFLLGRIYFTNDEYNFMLKDKFRYIGNLYIEMATAREIYIKENDENTLDVKDIYLFLKLIQKYEDSDGSSTFVSKKRSRIIFENCRKIKNSNTKLIMKIDSKIEKDNTIRFNPVLISKNGCDIHFMCDMFRLMVDFDNPYLSDLSQFKNKFHQYYERFLMIARFLDRH